MSRDTQFSQWAKAVLNRMLESRDRGWIDFNVWDQDEIEEYSTLLARAAYDLVSHVLLNTGPMMFDCFSHEEQIAAIPDMPALSKEQGE
jgi:hypothetical protein